jgi:hypothetical protein
MSDDNKEIITDDEENGADRNPLLRAAGGKRMADRIRDEAISEKLEITEIVRRIQNGGSYK